MLNSDTTYRSKEMHEKITPHPFYQTFVTQRKRTHSTQPPTQESGSQRTSPPFPRDMRSPKLTRESRRNSAPSRAPRRTWPKIPAIGGGTAISGVVVTCVVPSGGTTKASCAGPRISIWNVTHTHARVTTIIHFTLRKRSLASVDRHTARSSRGRLTLGGHRKILTPEGRGPVVDQTMATNY